jgi:uncharacterized protein YecT (DUF1311 family)
MRNLTNALPAALFLLSCAGSARAIAQAPVSPAAHQDVINGIALTPGVERRSYISGAYYGIRPAYDACVRETQGRVIDQGDCADAEFEYQDKRLNETYKAVTAHLSGESRQAAVDAQRAWLVFFAKDCAARAARFGSNKGPATESVCRMESTAYRAQQLEDWRSSLSVTQSH